MSERQVTREVAHRVFAAEYEDADLSYSESDEERAPNYVVTPSGARVNRLFAVGVLTETEDVNEEVLRARIVDPTGAFVVYAGQYQPDPLAFLERADPPTFVALTGKARTFQPDDAETVYTSVRPESVNEVDAATRDRWVVQTAERTLDRVAAMADALGRDERGDDLRAALLADGVRESLAAGIPRALEHYSTTPTYLAALRDLALDAARVVAGERDEVEELNASTDEAGETTLADLTASLDREVGTPGPTAGGADAAADEGMDSEPAETTASPGSATEADAGTAEPDAAPGSSTQETATAGRPETGADVEPETKEEIESSEPPVDETEPAAEPAKEPDDTAADSAPEGADETETLGGADQAVGSGDGAGTSSEVSAGDDDIGDFEGGEFELDESEREQLEDEYGTDFETGTEVDEPGEAGIETPAEAEEPEPSAETPPAEPDEAAESDSDGGDAGDSNENDDDAAADVDLGDAVMAAMEDLHEGDGVARDDVVAAVVDREGADPEAVEDAVQDVLMDGRCYEPDEGTLKPI